MARFLSDRGVSALSEVRPQNATWQISGPDPTPPGREATVYEGEDRSWRYSPIDRITCA